MKLFIMPHNEASLMKLNKEDLIRTTLDYQRKFNGVLDDLKRDMPDLENELPGLKSDFSKFEAVIQVTRNINFKLFERLVTIERTCYYNKQCSGRKCLEISGIAASVADNGIASRILEILEEIDVSIDPALVGDCHHLTFHDWPEKVMIKLNRRKDICRILLNKNKLKKFKPESVKLRGETEIFTNKSFHLHYKKLWSKL